MTDVQPTSKAAPGWYADVKRPGLERRWTGIAWADEWRPPLSFWSRPEGFMLTGFLVQLIGGLAGLFFVIGAEGADNDALAVLGFVTLGIVGLIGGALFIIGIIAKGVAVGRQQG